MFSPILATTTAGNVEVNASTDALVLTEYSATVSLDLTISATVDALVLAEYSAIVDVPGEIPAIIDRGGAPIRRYYYIPEKRRILTVEKNYDEQELVELIRRAAEKEDRLAARKLEQKARFVSDMETAMVDFHDAFVKAEQQIKNKYNQSQKRLREIQEEMNEEEHLILQILLEAA